jgi:carboxymethylenebutenolidase
MGERIRLPGTSGEHAAYFAPGNGPAVVVLQEYWGVTAQVCGMADRLAAEGFRVAVPDLYDGLVTDDRVVARERMLGIEVTAALATIDAVLGWLADGSAEPAGCVGFCMGGGLTLLAGERLAQVTAAVVFYGFLPWPEVTFEPGPGVAAFQLHYAQHDSFAPLPSAVQIARLVDDAGATAELWSYEAGHAFMDETRVESHDPESAARAWTRTVDFLRGALSPLSEEP